jgi:hypothetical protein
VTACGRPPRLDLTAEPARNEPVRRLLLSALIGIAGACVDEVDERPVSWSYIHAAIILPSCATSGCHSAFGQTSGISLQDREQARLLFVSGSIDTPLLKGLQAGVRRMPPDQPLPMADILLIERWILDGMPDN